LITVTVAYPFPPASCYPDLESWTSGFPMFPLKRKCLYWRIIPARKPTRGPCCTPGDIMTTCLVAWKSWTGITHSWTKAR